MVSSFEYCDTITCKYCGLTNVSKCGTYKGVQRYYCKFCKRKFKIDENVFYMRVPLKYVSSALSMYCRGKNINHIRKFLKQEHGYYPSWSLVYKWTEKFINKAVGIFVDSHPDVGDIWIAGETKLKISPRTIWVYEIMDTTTHYMLDQLIVEGDTRYHSRELLQNAIIIAGKSPQLILTCIHDIVGLEEVLRDTELIPVKPKKPEIYVEQVNSFLSMLKERDTILRSFKSLDTIRHYLDGWMVNYNYFQIQDILKDKTPAEAAGIFYQIKSWENLINERKYLAKRP